MQSRMERLSARLAEVRKAMKPDEPTNGKAAEPSRNERFLPLCGLLHSVLSPNHAETIVREYEASAASDAAKALAPALLDEIRTKRVIAKRSLSADRFAYVVDILADYAGEPDIIPQSVDVAAVVEAPSKASNGKRK